MKGFVKINIIALAVYLASCTASSKEADDAVEVQELPVTELKTSKTELFREYVGDVHAVKNVALYARVKGYLEQIYVDEGKEVKKGQVLFRINNEEYAAELSKAKANLQSAIAEAKAIEVEVGRVKMLVDKKVVSKTELEVVEARAAAVNARIEEARSAQSNAALRLSHTTIKAPFDGVVDRIPLKVGSLIDEGTLLTTVSDVSSVFTYFNVSENEYLEYVKTRGIDTDEHRAVDLMLADGSFFNQKGKIETMEGEFDEGTGSIAFRARFANPGKLLKHGSTGTVRLSNTIDDALLVPQKAVFEIQDKNFVYAVDKDNQVKMKSFVPRTRYAHYYIVQSGLEPGERIVYEGVQTLKDGAKITPKLVSADGVAVGAGNGLSMR
jgi:membrane fusion protein (multidrug efflux system)